MKLRKWIAGVTCACMMLTLSPPATVLAETAPQAAARSTTGDVTVTSGSSGNEDSLENGAIGAAPSNTTNIGSLQRMDGSVENAERFTGNASERVLSNGVVTGVETIDGEQGLYPFEELTVNSGAHLIINGKLTVDSATIINNGTITVNANGEIANEGTIENNGTFTNNGKIYATAGGYTNKGTFTNNGTYECMSPITNDGSFTNSTKGYMNVNGFLINNKTFTNNGTIDFHGVTSGDGTYSGSGKINLKPPVNGDKVGGYEVATNPDLVVQATDYFKVSDNKSDLKDKLPFETGKTYYIRRYTIFPGAPAGMVQVEWAEFSFSKDNQKQPPTVTIDYANETVKTNNTVEYRVVGGDEYWYEYYSEMKIPDYWFGKTVQFRTKGKIIDDYDASKNVYPSKGVSVPVPARETLKLKIDTAKEGVTVPGGHRYRVGGASNWTDGTGSFVTVAPGEKIEIVKPSTDKSFQSEVLTLTAPSKGGAPQVTPNYKQETLSTTTAMQYRLNDGDAWTDCDNDMSVAEKKWFGKTVQFRTKATDSNYASEAQSLTVSARNQAPTVDMDYTAETFRGTDGTMEYCVGDSGAWKDCTGNMKIPNECFGQNVQFRIKSTTNAFASAITPLDVPARPTAPTLKLDNATEAVTVPQDHYYNTTSAQYDKGDWTKGDGNAVQVGAEKTLYIYKAATVDAFKSQVQTLTAPAKGAQPSVTIAYADETLSTTTAMEYRVENGTWKDCTDAMEATAFGWNGKADVVVEFRTKATDKNYASDVQKVTIAQRPDVPKGVTPTHVSVVGYTDGALTNVTTAMEYKLDSATDWKPCGGTEVRDLAAGTYNVRVKATDKAFASEAETVTIKRGAQLAVDAVDLGEVAYGYKPQAHTITITNNGDCDATIESVAVSKDSNFVVTGSDKTVTAEGGTLTTYTIAPKPGLNAAADTPYTDTITVTYNGGATATAEVKVTVIKADPVVTPPTANDLTYNGSEQALVTAGTTNGGTLQYRLGDTGEYSTTVPKATDAGTYTVYYRVEGNDNFNPVAEQSLSVTINKAPQVVPAAPEAEKTTLYTITLKTVAEANDVKPEYGIKDKEGNYQWQETPVFEKLSSGTSYTFKVRYVESDNYLGAESAEAAIRTSSRPTYPPTIPEVEGGTVIVTPNRPTTGQTVTITPQPEPGMEVDKVEVTDKNGNTIEVTQTPNGDYTFKQPSGKVTITVTFKPAGSSDFPFIDVPKDAWYRGAVEYVYENGLIMGVAPNLFAPNMTTDRGQLVTMLWRLAGAPQATKPAGFNDVASDAYYAQAVAWAAESGITSGFGDGSFRPTTGLSREQMAALFMNYAQAMGIDTTARADISGFTDVDPNSWSYDALSWAKAVGLLNGVGDTAMAPQATATRAQIAAVLQRYCETIAKA